ncbi:MAG: carboxylesterase/lipase family protein, partial [Candidatus Sulfotelmatobacter sp.]
MIILLFSIALIASAAGKMQQTVRIDSGLVSGQVDSHGVSSYLGIPFAAPPVGNLRWRSPQPVAAWKGVRAADHFGASCMQDEMGVRLPWSRGFMTQGPISEDCLYLNVWATSPKQSKKEPVMVWIYGGGYSEGSSQVAVYNGGNLARNGVVIVTFDYRVGPLGFLAYPALTEESHHHSSGNYGLLDQIATLNWVHRNIAAFGGDPANVTIFGQSAGAGSVRILMTSPLAQGLFEHAITESGLGLFRGLDSRKSLADAEQQGVKYAERLGAHSLEQLRALPSGDFAKSIPGMPRGLSGFSPNLDDWVVTDNVPAHEVPLINGMVANDIGIADFGDGRSRARVTMEMYKTQIKTICGDQLATCLKLYPAENEKEAAAVLAAARRDRARVSIYLWATEQVKRGPVYTYYFDHAEPWPQYPLFGAFHTSEVPYVFQTISVLHRAWQPEDFKISRQMSSYWTNFAKRGNPNSPRLPDWPAFIAGSKTTMELGSRMGPMPLAEPQRLKFFLQYL